MRRHFTALVLVGVAGFAGFSGGIAGCVSNASGPAPLGDSGASFNEDGAAPVVDSGPGADSTVADSGTAGDSAAPADAHNPGDSTTADSSTTDSGPTDSSAASDAADSALADAADSASADAGTPTTIVLPGGPQAIAVNRSTKTFYVPYYEGASHTTPIAVIDATTGTITGTINVNFARGTLAIDETNDVLYASIYVNPMDGGPTSSSQIAVINGATNAVTSTINQTAGQAFDAGLNESNWAISFLAVDPAASRLYAYLQDGFGNGYIWQYDTTNATLIGNINTPGAEPGYGGGLVIDPTVHELWAVGGSFNTGSGITVVDTQTFSVSSQYTYPDNAQDVEADDLNGDAIMLFPVQPDGGAQGDGGQVQVDLRTGGHPRPQAITPNPLPMPSGRTAQYLQILGQEAAVLATDAAGNEYLLTFGAPDGGGAWAYQGSSAALALPAQSGTPFPTVPEGFVAVADSANVYALGRIFFDDLGTVFGPSSVQYWTVPIP